MPIELQDLRAGGESHLGRARRLDDVEVERRWVAQLGVHHQAFVTDEIAWSQSGAKAHPALAPGPHHERALAAQQQPRQPAALA